MIRRVKSVRTEWAQARYTVNMKNGAKALIKVNHSDIADTRASYTQSTAREKACLRALKGLAVPRLLSITPSSLEVLKWIPRDSFLAVSGHEGEKPADQVGLNGVEALAVWVFVVEQLAAFRRRRVVYQNLKCSNVLVSRSPWRVRIRGFENSQAIGGRGRLKLSAACTPQFAAPEVVACQGASESSLVYELGMLLAYALARTDNAALRARGLEKALKMTAELGAAGIGDIMARALSADPRERPGNFEDVFKRVRSAAMPREVHALWHALRAPHAKPLAALKLGCPRSCAHCRELAAWAKLRRLELELWNPGA